MTESGDSDISRQRRVGAASRRETQHRLQQAAAEEFIEHGYAAATVSRIAKRAGVTVQTLYLAWGSKRALLRAYMESRLAEGVGAPEGVADPFAGMTPHDITSNMAFVAGKAAESAATGWKLYRDAAATDPEIAADWDQLQALRRNTFDAIVAHIPKDALRPGLTRDAARDTAWAIASPESYDLLVRRAGYSPGEFERWMAVTLAAALLA